MKVAKISGLFLSIALCVGLLSCEKEEEQAELDYFTIEGANYVNAELPTGTPDLLTSFSVNNHVINGGTTLLSLSSEDELSKANVSIAGLPGYYECVLTKVPTKASGYSYQMVLNIRQTITVEIFVLQITTITTTGVVSRVYDSPPIQVVEAGVGQLQVSLSWDQMDDVDLHVIDPNGRHLYYGEIVAFEGDVDGNLVEFNFWCYWVKNNSYYNVNSLSIENEDDIILLVNYLNEIGRPSNNDYKKYLDEKGYTYYGYLDIDSNPGCYLDGVNNENIYYDDPIPGTYTIAVDLYSKCDLSNKGSIYSVSLNYKGKVIKFSDKQVGQFSNYYTGSANNPEDYAIIGTFVIDGTKTRAGNSDTVHSFPAIKEKYRLKR